MDLTAPWTIMLDHRLPEFRAVDLLACAAQFISGAGWGTRVPN